jgi:cathepsin B
VKDYKSGDFKNFGYNVGLALGKMFASPANFHELIADHVNHDSSLSWKATTYPQFANKTPEELKCYTGTILTDKTGKPSSFLDYTPEEVKSLPASFDSRTKWPDCIHAIRNQEQCGSCWAFAASEAISDRFCIASNGAINEVFSPQDLVSCSWNMGCSGGILYTTWLWLEYFGITTDSCVPYTSGAGDAGSCSKYCTGTTTPKTKEYVKFWSVHSYDNPDAIKLAIINDGPIETGFTVY